MGSPVTQWVLRSVAAGDVRCTVERIGEAFELTVVGPHGVIACETVSDTSSLLARADRQRHESAAAAASLRKESSV
jgi:hypothetical protein